MLKNWKKSKKYNSETNTIYKNILPQYQSFYDNYLISYGYNGEDYWVQITKEGKGKSITFKTKQKMLSFVKSYMRKN